MLTEGKTYILYHAFNEDSISNKTYGMKKTPDITW